MQPRALLRPALSASQRPVVEARGHWADFRCRPWHEVVRAVRCLPAARHRSAVSPSRGGIFGYLVGVVVIYIRAGGRGEGGGALGSSHIGRALGRSSTSAWYPLSAPLSRRLTGTHRMSMRCGYIGDNALQEETSARRGRYGAVLEASYSPIGGRWDSIASLECVHLARHCSRHMQQISGQY
jgi:hypothetical protein